MTRSYSVPTLEAPDLDAALDAMREHGLRASAARRLVLEAMFATDEPVTVEQIADGLGGACRAPTSPRSTAIWSGWRASGSCATSTSGTAPGSTCARGPEREFLLCDACGAVRSIDPSELDRVREVVREDLGHEASFTHFPIAGLCRDCAEQR